MALSKKVNSFIDEYMINGFDAIKAYDKVYKNLKPCEIEEKANKLIKKEEVIAEIERRKQKIEDDGKIRKEELMRVLKHLALSKYTDFMRVELYTEKQLKIDPETEEVYTEEVIKSRIIPTPSDKLTEEQKLMVKSVEMTKFGARYILYDKDAAIREINKLLGYYEEHKDEMEIEVKPDTEYLKDKSTTDLLNLVKELEKIEDKEAENDKQE